MPILKSTASSTDIPRAVEDKLTITGDGQTAFTLSSTPSGYAAFALYLNGQLRVSLTDYTFSGTSLTWLDPAGLTLKTTDILIARYNDTGISFPTQEIFYTFNDYNSNNSSYRMKSIGGTGNQNITFKIPDDFIALNSIYAIGQVTAGAAGSGKDIDLTSNYGTYGEAINQHSETDTTTTYDFTGFTNQNNNIIDLSVVLSSLSAGDIVGLNIDHNAIGGTIYYHGIIIKYEI